MVKKKEIRKEGYFGLCVVSVAPIRKFPRDQAEIISQMLFGETCVFLDKRGKDWIKIKCSWDNYEGWIDGKQLQIISEKDFEKYSKSTFRSLELSQLLITDNFSFPILLGSVLPFFDGMSFKMPGGKYVFPGQAISSADINITAGMVAKIAKKYVRAPYLWGGRSPFGIDCSGLTQIIFSMLGIKLPRDSKDQVHHGETVNFVSEAKVGDLAFFENEEGRIIHVGLILEDNKIIHASGYVRIDNLDHFGIYQVNRRKYSHKLRVIKRFF